MLVAGPSTWGYPTGLWSGALVADLIEKEFDQTLHPPYLATLLRQLGFSYQKARFESNHLNQTRRQAWLAEEWPAILATARAQKALVLFGDEASFAQWGSLSYSYTWALGGHQPVVPTSGIRRSYKVFGLIDWWKGINSK